MAVQTSPPVAPVTPVVTEDELRTRYVAYRRRHATRLVRMLPRDAIRPLYRRARFEAVRDGGGGAELAEDPLALLVAYCETLLPLPPFEIWRADFERNPDAHFVDLEDSLDDPTPEAPSTMESRGIELGDDRWTAHLRAFREDGALLDNWIITQQLE